MNFYIDLERNLLFLSFFKTLNLKRFVDLFYQFSVNMQNMTQITESLKDLETKIEVSFVILHRFISVYSEGFVKCFSDGEKC